MTRFEDLTIDDLPERVRATRDGPLLSIDGEDDLVTLAELERRYVRKVLASVHGNKAAAARILGIDRTTLYRKLGDPGEP